MNIAKNLERASLYFPEKPALIFEGRTYSYGELNGRCNRLANALRALGVNKGDRVGLFLPNIPAFPMAYFAVEKLGAIAVSINAMSKKREVNYIAGDSGCKVVFTTSELRKEVPVEELPALEKIIIAEGEAGNDLDMEALISAGDGDFRSLDMDPDDPAAILYTSGTTGFPKGATLTHRNVVTNSATAGNHAGVRPEDRMQLFLPLFHCFGQNFIMNSAFAKCATLVLHRRFEPEAVLQAVVDHRVTMLFAVPTIFIHLLNMDTSRYDLSSLRYFFTAAATMPRETALQWKEKFGIPACEGYGLTECSPHSLYNHDYRFKHGSVGTPVENVDVIIADEEGNELPPGEQGEILVRGPNVMKGYWGKPEETEKAIRNGWLHTGDIGKMDEEGYFFITDRLKDMINAAGFNVYPNEVEQVLYQHPAVQEAAVYGMADPVRGETVHASIVLKDGMQVGEEGLIEFCRANMSAYKVPRKIILTRELPKSPTGKILKRILRGDQ
ncbi:MAG: long-chain fatty acid--CoA ligase [Syntrophobacteraceae bacterium]|nr:long-chain fatty acid--CoA ligase [Syntrophobacteraceae bacterium]